VNYVKSNTITDPTLIVGALVLGDAYLVPPAGAGGDWADHEDQIATWGGSVWSFFAPPTAAEYQVTGGPNAGRIYVRSNVTPATISVVPNGDLAADTSGFAAWLLSETATGTADYTSGTIQLSSTDPGDVGRAKVTFPVISGVRYRVLLVLDSLTATAPDSLIQYKLRNEGGAADVDSGNLSTDGEHEFIFTAASSSYSFYVQAYSDTAEPASVSILSLNCYRIEELVLNPEFSSGFTDWTAPAPPWELDGDVALAVIDYPGHTPFPALRQTITGLQVGTYYRIAFDCEGNFTRGTISLAFDGTSIVDVAEEGSFSFYFKATATSHSLEFPLTKIGPSTFEAYLDNISMMAALWVAQPLAQGSIHGTSTISCTVAKGRRIAAVIAASSLVTCGATTTHGIRDARITAASSVSCGTTRIAARYVNPYIKAQSSMHVANLGKVHFITGTISAKGTVKVNTVDNGYYTAAMAVDAITELWSASPCSCNDGCGALQKAALEVLNAAMQRLNASGREWGFVSNVPLTLGPKTSTDGEIALPANVISVRRVVFKPSVNDPETEFGAFELRPIRTRFEVEAFRRSTTRNTWPLSGNETVLSPYLIPFGYFVEAEQLDASPPKLRLLFAPKFSALRAYKVEVQAHIQPPRLTCQSLAEGTILPIPHRFAETLLVPLAKFYAMSSRWFRRPDLAESITTQARDALLLTGEIQAAPVEAGKEATGGNDR